MSAGVYLYCIGKTEVLTNEALTTLKVSPADGSDAQLRVVSDGELAAVVSDTEIAEFQIQRDQVMAHHRVLESVMSLGDILPVAFGTVAQTDDDIVIGLLQGTGEELRANLNHIHGRVELSLRVMWDQDRLFEEIVDESVEIRRLRDSIAGVPDEEGFAERMQLGQLTSEAIAAKREYERDLILHELDPLAVDVQLKQGGGDLLVINASFLVDRDQEPAFDEAVQSVGGARSDRMRFRYLGPLPPASFVSVRIPQVE
jgi:hypothetical protein